MGGVFAFKSSGSVFAFPEFLHFPTQSHSLLCTFPLYLIALDMALAFLGPFFCTFLLFSLFRHDYCIPYWMYPFPFFFPPSSGDAMNMYGLGTHNRWRIVKDFGTSTGDLSCMIRDVLFRDDFLWLWPLFFYLYIFFCVRPARPSFAFAPTLKSCHRPFPICTRGREGFGSSLKVSWVIIA